MHSFTDPSIVRAFKKTIRQNIVEAVKKLDEDDRIFTNVPTDDIAPGYSDVVQNPMSFYMIESQIEDKYSKNDNQGLLALQNDLLLTFDNCAMYNGENSGSDITQHANQLLLQL